MLKSTIMKQIAEKFGLKVVDIPLSEPCKPEDMAGIPNENPFPVTVFVTAWQFNGGGGFFWFHNAEDADKAFEEEKKNCDGCNEEEWTAFRFDMQVTSHENATIEIEDNLIGNCDENPDTIQYPERKASFQLEG